jgi:hypothetical protein
MNSNPNLTRATVTVFALLTLISACGTTKTLAPPLPNDVPGEMQHLVYDVIAVNVETSSESRQTLGVEGGGQAAKEGFKLMAQAPIGCLGAGMMAGFCYAMMPFFPIITTVRAEEPEIARDALESFYARIEAYELHEKLESRLIARLQAENLPVTEPGSVESGERLITLNVYTSPLELQHSGYKNGYIDVTLPYTVELTDGAGNLLARKSGRATESFAESSRSTTLYPKLDEWLEKMVEQGINKMILEWQPEVTLGYTSPKKIERRTLIGIKYLDWQPVDSLKPRIEWQRLDEIIVAERWSEITDVSYEVEIFGYVKVPDEQHWQRRTVLMTKGLAEPSYVPETELQPCQRYYWQPKARFYYRGMMRTTTLSKIYELRTSGPGCKSPSYLLQDQPVISASSAQS